MMMTCLIMWMPGAAAAPCWKAGPFADGHRTSGTATASAVKGAPANRRRSFIPPSITHLAPWHYRGRDDPALDHVARWHRSDDHRAGCDLDIVAELDVRLDEDAGTEPDAVAQYDKAGGGARGSGRDVGAEPVVMVVRVVGRHEVVVAHDGVDAEVAERADDVARAERHVGGDPRRWV